MESLFDSIGAFVGGVFGLAQGGFDGVNQVMGLLIAVIAALLMKAWKGLWATALGAALVHVAVGVIRPVLDGGAFVLPDLLSLTFWMGVLALFLGYAIVIAVFFLVKSLVTGGGLGHRKAAH
ncbi:hypothetical protein [uncultured Brevundimonas sp.]|uniref:hypothetical protein n=1 Tax=uncultured Brevundimonas sp. TaxID=213418 RepID=UPI0026329F85|nr:hypothetical protein [uncultured Brevundimonas sp.]